MYSFNVETIEGIESSLSMPFDAIVALDLDDEVRLIESIIGKELVFSKTRDSRKIGRGSPYLARRRFKTIEEIDDRLTEICDASIR